MTDPMGDFGPGGLANEAHLGGMHSGMFPGAPGYSSEAADAGQWTGSGGAGGYVQRRPGIGARVGARIFGRSWGRVSRAMVVLARLGCAAIGFRLGAFYTPEVIGWDRTTDVTLFVGGAIGAVLGLIAPLVFRLMLPLILLVGGMILVAKYFF